MLNDETCLYIHASAHVDIVKTLSWRVVFLKFISTNACGCVGVGGGGDSDGGGGGDGGRGGGGSGDAVASTEEYDFKSLKRY